MRLPVKILALVVATGLTVMSIAATAAPQPAPERDRGDGPHARLILRGVIVVAGNGAPPVGPMDIVIENDRITGLVSVGNPGAEIDPDNRPRAGEGDQVLDLDGHYVLPGFVDMHGHLGGDEQGVTAEYVLKLWLAHGITTVREPGSFNGLDWVLDHVRRSNDNSIVAPRIIPYAGFGMGADAPISTPKMAREWVRDIARQGAEGVKFFGAPPAIMQAAFDELNKQNLGSAMHHAQLNVVRWNVLDSAREGLTTMEHWYGLPEAMFDDQVIQDYPLDYNYNNEQHRFGEAGRLWQQAAAPGSERWMAVRDELIELDFTINPTLTIYEASRDLMREQRAIWHDEYAHPKLLAFFQPSPEAHGSYWFDWTTQNEIDWKRNYQRWMQFLNDFKNHGGRVTTGSDAGYIYKLYGFGYIRELELLQEAGFHPLEVLQAATLNGAEALGMTDEIGSIEVGKKADLAVVSENPLRNFKLLYGSGHYRLLDDGTPGYVRGLRYTIKDGIIYDTEKLLQDVRNIVAAAKAESS